MGKTVSLLDAVKAEARPPGSKCGVATLRSKISDAGVRGDFDRLLADPDTPASALSKGLDKLGYHCSAFTLRRHRQGSCGCPR